MILALSPSRARGLAAAGLVAVLAAGCSAPTGTVSFTPEPTLPPAGPSYSLAPLPSGCPTAVPEAAPAGSTATVTMTTNYGAIVIKVEANLGPNAAGAFLALARCGYYNNVIFHRIIAGFIAQAGDGTNARLPLINVDNMGLGGPEWTIKDDPIASGDPYLRGTLAVANTGCHTSGNSQFFIVLADGNGLASASTSPSQCPAEQPSPEASATAGPGPGYAIFGRVTSGMDVVDKIAAVPVGGFDPSAQAPSRPIVPVVITGTTVTTP
jgi:cyclophilin family peptidyl-prolyl cis-trans isomerase